MYLFCRALLQLYFTIQTKYQKKKVVYKLFLLHKFPPGSTKYLFSKVLMILYIFLICNYIIGFLINVNLNIKPVLIIAILYPLGVRAFFNGSYSRYNYDRGKNNEK